MRFKRNLSKTADTSGTDLEKGPATREPNRESSARKGPTAEEEPQIENSSAGDQPTDDVDDDSDHNDKVWKLFLDAVAPVAKSRVKIWQTELDAVLVFTGLFAGVVSAFLVDLRSHLRPDLQLIALNQIASILRNDTNPLELEQPSLAVRGVAILWYSSLVITLFSALCGVLAKGWLGEILRELPLSDADQALGRWKRDKTARNWQMGDVVMAVPLLTQLALAMFLSGFVIQSFDDNHSVGLGVLIFVSLGASAYAMFTVLPRVYPDCPYRTPLSKIVPHTLPTIASNYVNRVNRDANTNAKIQILTSRLNRNSNDEIFHAAASTLAVKLESHDSMKWHKAIEKRAGEIADAFFGRLKNLTHQVDRITSTSILKHTASSGTKDVLETMTQHVTACLHVLLKMTEYSLGSDFDNRSPWINQDIDHRLRSSTIFPDTCRLLATSLYITKLVAKQGDYRKDEIATIDWENMIRPIYDSDFDLRATSGVSACRGLIHGKENLKQVCSLGVAMFIEVEVTTPRDSLKRIFVEKDGDILVSIGKDIIEKLWSELVKGWKNAVVELLSQTEEDDRNSVVKLLDHALYRSDIRASISAVILAQLGSTNWITRKEAVRMLSKLVEHDIFQEAVETTGAIAKVIDMVEDSDEAVRTAAIGALSIFSEKCSDAFTETMKSARGITKLVTILTDEDSNVRVAAINALLQFSKHDSHKSDVETSIPVIVKQLDADDWRIREQIIRNLIHLSEITWCRQVLEREGIISKLVTMLEDDDSDVQAAAIEAVLIFRSDELYQDDIKSSIPTMIRHLENESWDIREKAIKLLVELSVFEFQEILNANGIIPKVVARLEDSDSDVRAAAVVAIRLFKETQYELYYSNIKSSFPSIIKLLDNTLWDIRRDTVQTLAMFSQHVDFRETIMINKTVTKFVAKLEDADEDVRAAVIQALLDLGTQRYFKDTMGYQNIPSSLYAKLSDSSGSVRFIAAQAVCRLSMDEGHGEEIKSLISISSFVSQLQNDNWSARQQAIKILAQFAGNIDFQIAMNAEQTIPMLGNILANDHDEGVRTAAAEALSVFGRQESFQQTLQSGNIILTLASKLSDPYSAVRNAAQLTILALSQEVIYQNDIRSAIPSIVNYLEDKNPTIRQQALQMLAMLSERLVFRDTMETEMSVAKVVAKLEDPDADVGAAAARALSTFGTNGFYRERLKVEHVISKLIGKLGGDDKGVHSAVYDALVILGRRGDMMEFLQEVLSTLITAEKPMRMEVYKMLRDLRDDDIFVYEVDMAICQLLTQMTQKDLYYIRRSIAILAETADEDLRGGGLDFPSAFNKSARDAVETVVGSKLVYEKDSPNRYDVVLALSQLAKHDAFLGCMKNAIPGLIMAVNSNDWNVWNLAFGAISALSREDKFRAELVPLIQKLIQELIAWNENDEYPLILIEAMLTLVEYKEFQLKLKQVVSVLMNQLPTGPQVVRSDAVTFYKATCRLISKICEIEDGRELVPKLARILPNMDISLTEDLFELLRNIVNHGRLTLNDRIALASSLHIVSPAPATKLAVQVCKLNMAALLNDQHSLDLPTLEYRTFLDAVLGSDSDAAQLLASEPDKPKGAVENILRNLNTSKYLPFA